MDLVALFSALLVFLTVYRIKELLHLNTVHNFHQMPTNIEAVFLG